MPAVHDNRFVDVGIFSTLTRQLVAIGQRLKGLSA